MLVILVILWVAKSIDLTCPLSACPDIKKGDHNCNPECMSSYCNYDTNFQINGLLQKENSDCYQNCINFDGCDPKNLGNNICDISCNTQNCGFDWGDCTCSPECSDSMLGDGKCDDACNNWNCDLDNHDCGHCADGCFPTMLGNGICDPECNNEDCLYDYNDCQCADNCLWTDYGLCKPECLVNSCNFDKVDQYPNNWCYNTTLAIFSSYQQIIRDDFSYIVHIEDCYEASNYACSLEKALNFSNCYEECNILECNYGNGNCYQINEESYCQHSYQEIDGCMSCRNGYNLAGVLRNKNCEYSIGEEVGITKFPDDSFVITPILDTSSSKNPHIYIIKSDGNPGSTTGNGTSFYPYTDISFGLSRIKHNFSIVYLLEGDYSYALLMHLHINLMVDYGYVTPREAFANFPGKSIKITPINSNPITLKRAPTDNLESSTFWFYIKDVKSFEINNIIFDWHDTAPDCISGEYCDYCPFVAYDSDSNAYYNDRGEIIDEFLLNSWCLQDSQASFIQLLSSNLILNNVKFINFRTGFKSMLCTMNGSNTTFNNVIFDNIKVYDGDSSGIVMELCADSSYYETNTGNSYGNFKYEDGIVSRVNNGYEMNDTINLKGFINVENISTIVLRNIVFKNNVVFKKSQTGTNEASLFYLNMFQWFLIDSCTFEYNYCDLGLINIQQNNNEFRAEINDNEEIIYSTLSNVYIHNSNFTSNYGKTSGILYASYEGKSQNFLIEGSLFNLNGIETGALIHIESSYANQKYLVDSIINLTASDGSTFQGKYLAKWGKILNSKFNVNYSGENGIIELIRMINIELENSEISYNGAIFSESMNINSLFLNHYIENSDLYVKLNIIDPIDLDCKFLSSISDSINFNIESVNIQKNYCKSYSPSIFISNTTNTTIKSAYFKENSGSGNDGICLEINENELIPIIDSEFISNLNYESGSKGAISSLSNLLLQNCTFYNNTGDLGGALYFAGQFLSINSSRFDSNISPNLDGGAIYFIISSSNSQPFQLYILNTTFTNNFGGLYGGAIFIHRNSPLESILSLTILDSYFYNNQALEGSCIYIDYSTLISADSLIYNSNFQENKASFTSAISIYYTNGLISFSKCTFTNNIGAYSSGFNIAIGENNEILISKIIFNSCIFQYNTGIVTISLDNSNINSTLETNNCLFEYNEGSIYSLDNDYVTDKNSNYLHNYSPISGAVLNLKNSAVFQSEKAIYSNCSSNLNGGVASISLKSQFFCFSCIFTQNFAGSSGGVIYSDSNAQFHIYNSFINKNTCKNRGSAIFMAGSLISSSINSTEISENFAYNEGAITLLSSKMSIAYLKISNNSAGGKNPGISLEDSNITIISSAFSDQSGHQGCFILLSMSYLKAFNSSFTNGFSDSSGVAIHATSSTLSIFSTNFLNLLSADNKGIIYLYESSTMQIENSSFISSTTPIDSSSSSLFISNSTFRNYSNSAILGVHMLSLLIKNSEFSDGSGVNGGALYCSQCSNISIISSYFVNNFAEKGGAIYISNQDNNNDYQCNITYTSFISNSAGNGGAIWVSTTNLFIFSSNFYENQAKSWQTETPQEIIDGIGGGMKISCENSDMLCDFDISSNNFSSNSAAYNGGGISWDDSKPELENNAFWNNSAQYGNDISSYPIMMVFINKANNRALEDSLNTLTLNNIASGQKNNPPLTFALVDDLYQIITTDITSQAQLKSISNDTVISGTSTLYAENGIFYFEDYAISATPGSSIQIYIDSSAIDESKINAAQTSSQFFINIKMRLCEIGEAKVGIECERCLENYYNIDAKESKCLECPSSAVCYGNYTMVPKSGYWRTNEFTDHFWKCRYSPACLGSPDSKNISFTGICKEGYNNNLCHSCEKGYSRLYKNECQECPNTVSNAFWIIGIFALFIFIAIVIIKFSRKTVFESVSFSSIYIKVFWNYLQIIVIIATFNLNWPYEVAQYFHIQIFVDYIRVMLFSIDCFLQSSYSKNDIYYYRLVIASIAPFFLSFICLLSWVIIYIIKRKNIKDIKNDYISSFTVLLFLIHPSIIDIMFGIFSCKEINNGEYWLNADLGIRCWDYNHLFYALLFALPTISIWVIAVPALCLIKLQKCKNLLEDISTKLKFGFLINGYDSKHYSWEFLILYYKVALIACSVFFSNISINIQAITVALLLGLFLHIQAKNQPYCKTSFNKADTFSRLVCLITILAGLFFLTGDLDTIEKNILISILLLFNSSFMIYIIFQLLLRFYIFKTAIRIFKRIFSLNKWRKYAIDDNGENSSKFDKDYSPLASPNKRLISTTMVYEDSNNSHLPEFKKNANTSLEIDPLPSESSN